MQFGANVIIYMAIKILLTYNVNQWYLYNDIADNYINNSQWDDVLRVMIKAL